MPDFSHFIILSNLDIFSFIIYNFKIFNNLQIKILHNKPFFTSPLTLFMKIDAKVRIFKDMTMIKKYNYYKKKVYLCTF